MDPGGKEVQIRRIEAAGQRRGWGNQGSTRPQDHFTVFFLG